MNPEEFQLACLTLQDHQRLIAAGKVQRWEVLKWAISVNLALTAAGLATTAPRWVMFFFSALVAFAAFALLYHYNANITKVRKSAIKLISVLRTTFPKIDEFIESYPADIELKDYDRKETIVFAQVIGLSVFPTFFVWMASLAL